jgi:predicted hydrolase (HD superfamily)
MLAGNPSNGGEVQLHAQSAAFSLWKSIIKCTKNAAVEEAPRNQIVKQANGAEIDAPRAVCKGVYQLCSAGCVRIFSVFLIDMDGNHSREKAWELLTEFTQSESLRKHALAVEACMRACSKKYGDGTPEAENLWGVVGLIHDFDYERWPSAEEHPYKGNEILKERGYSDEIRRAIMSHAEYSGVSRDTPIEKALFACDELAGFITAVALIKPSKSLAEVDAKSVRKRMKDKAFARKVNRDDIINGAKDLGVDLDEHITFCIEALKPIAKELGLDGSAAKALESA